MSLLYSTPVMMAVYADGKWQSVSSGSSPTSMPLIAGGSSTAAVSLVLIPLSSPDSEVKPGDQFALGFFDGQLIGPQDSKGTLGSPVSSVSASETTVFTMPGGTKVPRVANSMTEITDSTTLVIDDQALGLLPGPQTGYYYMAAVPKAQAVKVGFFKDPYHYGGLAKPSSKSDSRVMWMAIFGLAAGGATWVCLRGKTYQAQASVVAGGVAAGAAWFAF